MSFRDLVDVYPTRAPWEEIMSDLIERGVSPRQVAEHLGLAYDTVRKWTAGHEPMHAKGEALFTFHLAVCGPTLNGQRRAESRPVYDHKAFAATLATA